jgi:hypothetical protein
MAAPRRSEGPPDLLHRIDHRRCHARILELNTLCRRVQGRGHNKAEPESGDDEGGQHIGQVARTRAQLGEQHHADRPQQQPRHDEPPRSESRQQPDLGNGRGENQAEGKGRKAARS